jgi:hypothetical protein
MYTYFGLLSAGALIFFGLSLIASALGKIGKSIDKLESRTPNQI